MPPASEMFIAAGTPPKICSRFHPACAALEMAFATSSVVNREEAAHAIADLSSCSITLPSSLVVVYWVDSATCASSIASS